MPPLTDHINYIEKILVHQLVNNFDNEEIVDFEIKHAGGLDGFMSELYKIELKTIQKLTKENKLYQLLAKFMKGDVEFRVSSKSYTMFPNEIHIYSTVLPYYAEIIQKSKSQIQINEWVPKTYMSKYGQIDGIGDGVYPECVLVMENLEPLGYRCASVLLLDRSHLLLMVKPLAEYHAMTYALRIQKDPKLQKLIDDIVPVSFISNHCEAISKDEGEQKTPNLYEVVYGLAFERFFAYFDKLKVDYDKSSASNYDDFFKDLNKLRTKYFKNPEYLMEEIRLEAVNNPSDVFPAILHGDFNRNNMLFQYETVAGELVPKDAKMIDFQELRYGTIAIDLSFFMYINMDPALRESDFWMEILKFYHDTLIKSIASILKCEINDDLLKPYNFDAFYEHFTKYAFYGAMVCLHFMPWLVCSKEELAELSMQFSTNMNGPEFRKVSLECGGDEPDKLLIEIIKHAHRMGYIQNFIQ